MSEGNKSNGNDDEFVTVDVKPVDDLKSSVNESCNRSQNPRSKKLITETNYTRKNKKPK